MKVLKQPFPKTNPKVDAFLGLLRFVENATEKSREGLLKHLDHYEKTSATVYRATRIGPVKLLHLLQRKSTKLELLKLYSFTTDKDVAEKFMTETLSDDLSRVLVKVRGEGYDLAKSAEKLMPEFSKWFEENYEYFESVFDLKVFNSTTLNKYKIPKKLIDFTKWPYRISYSLKVRLSPEDIKKLNVFQTIHDTVYLLLAEKEIVVPGPIKINATNLGGFDNIIVDPLTKKESVELVKHIVRNGVHPFKMTDRLAEGGLKIAQTITKNRDYKIAKADISDHRFFVVFKIKSLLVEVEDAKVKLYANNATSKKLAQEIRDQLPANISVKISGA